MAEPARAPLRQSALGALLAPRPAGQDRAAIRLHERESLLIQQIAAWRAADLAPLRTALAERLGIALPDGRDGARAGGRVALPIAPRRWWLVEHQERAAEADLGAVITSRAALTDLSHARTVLRLGGPAGRSVLAKLCRIDLHARALPPGRVAQTALGQVPALIHAQDDEPSFDLYLPRSLAASAVASLIDAAEEFGIALS
jgi:heterotetrameric sarcosine oxidase gamma subunit